MITIRQVMTSPAAYVPPDATTAETIEFLASHHIGSAPVATGDGKLVGIVSELSLIDVAFDPTIRHQPIRNFMTEEVHSVDPDEPLSRAAQLFALYAFRRLPVVENGRLVGVITRRDLMTYLLRADMVLSDPLWDLIPSLATVADPSVEVVCAADCT